MFKTVFGCSVLGVKNKFKLKCQIQLQNKFKFKRARSRMFGVKNKFKPQIRTHNFFTVYFIPITEYCLLMSKSNPSSSVFQNQLRTHKFSLFTLGLLPVLRGRMACSRFKRDIEGSHISETAVVGDGRYFFLRIRTVGQ